MCHIRQTINTRVSDDSHHDAELHDLRIFTTSFRTREEDQHYTNLLSILNIVTMRTIIAIASTTLILSSSVTALNPECSAHPMCRGLSGDCCPTTDFVYCKRWRTILESSNTNSICMNVLTVMLVSSLVESVVSGSRHINQWTVVRGLGPSVRSIQHANERGSRISVARRWCVNDAFLLFTQEYTHLINEALLLDWSPTAGWWNARLLWRIKSRWSSIMLRLSTM